MGGDGVGEEGRVEERRLIRTAPFLSLSLSISLTLSLSLLEGVTKDLYY
jgi:hypothetical protein